MLIQLGNALATAVEPAVLRNFRRLTLIISAQLTIIGLHFAVKRGDILQAYFLTFRGESGKRLHGENCAELFGI